MTLTQLSYIVAVDTYRHFATAAEKSFVTQPTLSMQIQKLEDELGVVIFDRSKQPVIPTEVGAKIIEQARIVLKEAQHIQTIIESNKDEMEGTFRIGIIPTVASNLIPLFLHTFTEKYPTIQLIFEELLTRDILSKLQDDQLDAGIIGTPLPGNQFKELSLYFEPFDVYLSENHPLLKKESLELDDLESDQMWLLSEGHCLRDQSIDLCKKVKSQRDRNVQFESGNLETLIRIVDQGKGMTILPYLTYSGLSETQKKHVRTFSNRQLGRNVKMVFGRLYTKNKMLHALRDHILSCVPTDLVKQSS
ncbi:hydrogen peroxide-inducible genes activator [bacterium]|nr:MAG: hydrogen peroxide-inducible genes activator [bacterium]